jgi:hypothetical protein
MSKSDSQGGNKLPSTQLKLNQVTLHDAQSQAIIGYAYYAVYVGTKNRELIYNSLVAADPAHAPTELEYHQEQAKATFAKHTADLNRRHSIASSNPQDLLR